jgi:CRP-like cAMP-binding protein
MSTQPSIEQAFGAVALFSHLTDRQRGRLAALATTRSYEAGAVIVRAGDTSMSFYVVLSGRVRVQRPGARDGGGHVRELGPTGSFGEMGLIDDQPRSATVVAIEPTTCGLLAKWDFANELREDPDIALALLPVLHGRIRELEARLDRPSAAAVET